MPVGIPSVETLRDTFLRAVKQALGKCEETHISYYGSRFRSLTSTPWVEIGPNVQVIQMEGAECLIRGSWQYVINRHADGQLQIARAQIRQITEILAAAVPHGEPVKVTFDFPPTDVSASGERVTCSFVGVVRGQVLCGT